MIKKIIKRDGTVQDFDKNKIKNAILKAFIATGEKNGSIAEKLADEVVEILEERIKGIPHVEDVQDIVEEVLIKHGYAKVAKAYILYRKEREKIREAKKFLGVYKDELKLTVNAVEVLRRRYLLRDEKGNIIETPLQMFKRVARAIASIEKHRDRWEKLFLKIMTNLEFLPNSPTLMNAGTDLGVLSACFVLPIEDSLESIFNTLKYTALIHKAGGGTGFNFSKIRPKGDVVRSTKGIASGPVSFMRIFDVATDVIKQGGKRRGANMGILNYNHPDIIEFITCKEKEGVFENFNISVAVTDEFMEKAIKGEEYELINPRTEKAVGTINAKDVFDLIVANAWRSGDPGIIFLDEINRHNPTPKLGLIEATNPCGEVPLLPYESCNLGSINLSKFVNKNEIDFERLGEVVRISTRFLDNVIDVNKYPLKEIDFATKRTRKIGLGVMGFAEMLIKLGIPYDSDEGIKTAEKVMKFISETARETSRELALERGVFPAFDESIYKGKYDALRNATVTTIAPTGTISIIAGTTSGIEPLFAVAYVREVLEGVRLVEVNKVFEEIAKERGFYSKDLITKIAKVGSVQKIEEVPRDVKRLFVTALDIDPEWHVKMQAAFQKYTDNAVAKTVNLPQRATLEDVRRVFLLAYKLRCKGITVYRYGSKSRQVLYVGEHVKVSSEYSGGCARGEICEI